MILAIADSLVVGIDLFIIYKSLAWLVQLAQNSEYYQLLYARYLLVTTRHFRCLHSHTHLRSMIPCHLEKYSIRSISTDYVNLVKSDQYNEQSCIQSTRA
jgi:hypothetical protein